MEIVADEFGPDFDVPEFVLRDDPAQPEGLTFTPSPRAGKRPGSPLGPFLPSKRPRQVARHDNPVETQSVDSSDELESRPSSVFSDKSTGDSTVTSNIDLTGPDPPDTDDASTKLATDLLQDTLAVLRSNQKLQSNHIYLCLRRFLYDKPDWCYLEPGYPLSTVFTERLLPQNPNNTLVILNSHSHWSLGHLDVQAGQFDHYNPMKGIKMDFSMIEAWMAKKKHLAVDEIRFIEKECPQQSDVVNCGIFVLSFAMSLWQGKPVAKLQSVNTQAVRKELAERLSSKVLTASSLKPEALPQEHTSVAAESSKTNENVTAFDTSSGARVSKSATLAASVDAKSELPNTAKGVGQKEGGVTVKDVDDNKEEIQPATESTTTMRDKAAATTHAKATPATHAVSQLAEFCRTYLLLQEAHEESHSKLTTTNNKIKKAVVSLALKANTFEASSKSVRTAQTALRKSEALASYALQFRGYVEKYDRPPEDDDDVRAMTVKVADIVSECYTKYDLEVQGLTHELAKQRALEQDLANAVEESMAKLNGLVEEKVPLARSHVAIAKEFAIMQYGKKQWDTIINGDTS